MNHLSHPANTDSYKLTHSRQYPDGTRNVLSTIEARGTSIPGINKTLFFGLQPALLNLAKRVTEQDIEEMISVSAAHGVPFDEDLWDTILVKHQGRIPLKIEALPEGSLVPHRVPMVRITSTDPKMSSLVSHFETQLLRAVWYPTTVATISNDIYQMMVRDFGHTVDDISEIRFKLHDFGARGASSAETAALGGMAHLLSFRGTDTVSSMLMAKNVYNADISKIGFSIPASEHSTMTSWGKVGEVDAYRRMVELYAKPGAIFACVCDSYDLFNAISIWKTSGLFDLVKQRDATVVIRPDSGDPTVIPVQVIERLMRLEGYTTNKKGYDVLPPHIRVIQGDGVNRDSIKTILTNMTVRNMSLSNIAFGMGGALLQKVDRDTFKFAQKASAIQDSDGNWKPIFKDPITDPGKRSHRGIVNVFRGMSDYFSEDNSPSILEGAFKTVFENGVCKNLENFEQIRERVDQETQRQIMNSRTEREMEEMIE